MKAFVLFFVLGVSSYAQKSFPDTLYLFNNNIVPCLITEYSDSRIYFSFSQNNSETLISEAIDKYTVEGFGIVYTRDKGLIVNQELLEEFIETRREKNNLQYAIDKELARISQYNSESNNKDPQILENIQNTNFNKDKLSRWGFGFLIVPYYATNVYFIENINYSPIVSSYIENEFNLIASMSYSFNSNIKATVELGYSASSLEDKNENYTTINNNLIESRTVTKEELQLFDFILGLKYYFNDFAARKVQFYSEIGIGKQFGSFQDDYKNLSQSPPNDYTQTDNNEEFIEDLNSPFHLQVGFGAEYFFNSSLSVNTNFKLFYSQIDAEYKYRFVSENRTETRKRNYSFENYFTRVGFGLNFYF